MRSITSALGEVQTVTVRRSESSDAEGVTALISINPSSVSVFGRVNVLHLLEKANLAVTLCSDKDEVLAQACFSDHPLGELVDQAEWETYLQHITGNNKYSPVNTLFLHLFVAEPMFAAASSLEIMRAAFSAVPELQFILLLSPYVHDLDSALSEIFEPLQLVSDVKCVSQVCVRDQHCPKLSIRPARVEDHDDVMRVFSEQTSVLAVMDRPFFLAELIEAQNQYNHTAVCESDGAAVGFISVSTQINVKRLQHDYDLTEFTGVFTRGKSEENTDQSEHREDLGLASHQEPTDLLKPLRCVQQEQKDGPEELCHTHTAFSVQFFAIDKNHESRSVDFLPYLFKRFPERDLCLVTAPSLSPELTLLQTFLRVPPKSLCSPNQELYVLHRRALRPVRVRRALPSDRDSVLDLLGDLEQKDYLLQDLDLFYQREIDQDRVPLQSFVALDGCELVGIVTIRDEQEIEYIRAHYNIDNFIYFSHHPYHQHATIRHFVLRSALRHSCRLLFREVLRLSHKSCLYHRVYPPHSPVRQSTCTTHLDFLLDCAVPVRPRPQVDFPLDQLGPNAPSNQITERQPPFSLYLMSRKLTLEQKVVVNARLVVGGASDTGLGLIETLCCCPHLRFTSLTLVSPHGLPRDGEEELGFLSTSHAYSPRALSLLPLSSVHTIPDKILSINRKSKHVQVSDRKWLHYDFLLLCTGLQYQVPCCSGEVPLNLFNLNDLQDCVKVRHWLKENFLHKQTDHIIVYGSGLDVFMSVEALLSLGVSGSRIHLVLGLTETETGSESLIPDPAVDRAVGLNLDQAGIRVYRDCVVREMKTEENQLTSVTFTTNGKDLQISCGAFLNLSSPGVDPDLFRSLLESFLVFDSRLVIDSSFRTSDPWILGAGPLTRFSRRYHTPEWDHSRVCSREVGLDLAQQVLQLFDPTTESRPEETGLVPVYNQPKVTGGKLPRGLHYLHTTRPTPCIQTRVRQLKDSPLVTGAADSGDYFRLQLDDLERVESLTCLSLKPLPLTNLLRLNSLQQILLRHLSTRYHLGQVKDLYRFFRESWCLAVFHDRFGDFHQELRAVARTTVERAEDDSGADEESRGRSSSELLDPETRASIRTGAVRYLSYNRNLLPTFAVPGDI